MRFDAFIGVQLFSTEMNRIHLVLFDMNNRIFRLYLAAIRTNLVSVVVRCGDTGSHLPAAAALAFSGGSRRGFHTLIVPLRFKCETHHSIQGFTQGLMPFRVSHRSGVRIAQSCKSFKVSTRSGFCALGSNALGFRTALGELWCYCLKVAVGCADGSVTLVDVATGATTATLVGHRGSIQSLSWARLSAADGMTSSPLYDSGWQYEAGAMATPPAESGLDVAAVVPRSIQRDAATDPAKHPPLGDGAALEPNSDSQQHNAVDSGKIEDDEEKIGAPCRRSTLLQRWFLFAKYLCGAPKWFPLVAVMNPGPERPALSACLGGSVSDEDSRELVAANGGELDRSQEAAPTAGVQDLLASGSADGSLRVWDCRWSHAFICPSAACRSPVTDATPRVSKLSWALTALRNRAFEATRDAKNMCLTQCSVDPQKQPGGGAAADTICAVHAGTAGPLGAKPRAEGPAVDCGGVGAFGCSERQRTSAPLYRLRRWVRVPRCGLAWIT
jgi:hypothetical protein